MLQLRSMTLVALASLSLLTAQAPAHAQEQAPQQSSSLDGPYFAIELMLGAGGTLSTGSVSAAGVTVNASGSDDLRLTFGGGAEYMHPLHRYFALGGRFGIASWQSRGEHNAGASRNLMLDLSLVPQGRLPITSTIELYLGVPIGLTVDFLNSVSASVTGLASVKADPGFGLNLGLLLGARFALSKNVGLFTELGYGLHKFSHTLSVQALGVSASGNMSLTLEQIALNFGVFF
jgi:hypothetical protein